MSAVQKKIVTEQEYLQHERAAFEKSEYFKGEIFAMAGASKEHNKIVASVIVATGPHLMKKGCAIFPSDLRINNSLNSFYTYPDITVVCGTEEYLDDKFDTLVNPTVIFEVLSSATEDYDRGTKFKLYRSIASLQNYVLISSTEVWAEVYSRKLDTWVLTTKKNPGDHIHIHAIDYDLSLAEVYAQVKSLLP